DRQGAYAHAHTPLRRQARPERVCKTSDDSSTALTSDRRLAIIFELAHDGRISHRSAAAVRAVFERQAKIVFDEERVELLLPDGSGRMELVARGIVRKGDCRQRLRRRSCD